MRGATTVLQNEEAKDRATTLRNRVPLSAKGNPKMVGASDLNCLGGLGELHLREKTGAFCFLYRQAFREHCDASSHSPAASTGENLV